MSANGSDVCKDCIRAEEDRQSRLSANCAHQLFELLVKNQFTQQAADGSIARFQSEGLTDTVSARRSLYSKVFTHYGQDEIISPAERRQLATIQRMIRLSDADVEEINLSFQKLEVIWMLRRGELPNMQVSVPLQRHESGILEEENVVFMQERVVGRRYEGRSSGVSIRICKGLSYRVGVHRGRLITDKQIVRLDCGRALVTNKRFLFAGPQKAFSFPLGKILYVEPFGDGFAITRDSHAQNSAPYLFQTEKAELFLLAFSNLVNAEPSGGGT
jgi:hypothetical protein